MRRERNQAAALAGLWFERDRAQVAVEKTRRNRRHFPFLAPGDRHLMRQPAVEGHAVGVGDGQQAARPVRAHERGP